MRRDPRLLINRLTNYDDIELNGEELHLYHRQSLELLGEIADTLRDMHSTLELIEVSTREKK